DREVGVVRHDLGAGPPRLTRYVALRVPAGTPHLLVSAAEPRQGRPGTVPYREVLPADLGSPPPADAALGRLDGDLLVHGDAVLADLDEVLPTALRARLVELGLGSVEVADGWAVATRLAPTSLVDVAEWEAVGDTLDVLEELASRLAAV
ncbi:hypothetical protein, partial [Desertihabitans aurantiacus]|uniref:hypothetical protein n=1 Tax=Desertihabitans aurantiacus TaxID=2282477 RepID=UPI0018E52FB3